MLKCDKCGGDYVMVPVTSTPYTSMCIKCKSMGPFWEQVIRGDYTMLIDELGIYTNKIGTKVDIVYINKDTDIACGLVTNKHAVSYRLDGSAYGNEHNIVKKYKEPRTISQDLYIYEENATKKLSIRNSVLLSVGFKLIKKETVTFTVE